METKTTIQFDVLDTEMLASIEGGTASAVVVWLHQELELGLEVFYEHNIVQLYGLSLDFYRKGVNLG